MKGKLHKMVSGYILSLNGDIDDPYAIVNEELAKDYEWYKLSLKNCKVIELGYDLEELVDEYTEEWRFNERIGFRDGFRKALEVLGDKKFSKKELTMLFAYGHQIGMNSILAIQSQHSPQPIPKPDSDKLRDEFIQSLQKTEWDVEIEMICPHPEDTYVCGIQYGCDEDGCNHPNKVPFLDNDGCLILKRI